MAETAPSHNLVEYSVTEIAGALKRVVEDNFGFVRVRGEVSGCKVHTSGHCYLTLKDEGAVLQAVCWKGMVARLPFRPEDGMEVVCLGRISTFAGKSQYQLVIEWMEPAGIGALMARFEQLKKQLGAEGLFDREKKRPLPFMPEVIGVVTSPTGAVIRDILHRIGDRFPRRVLLWPVPVQGADAAEKIAAAVAGFNARTPAPGVPRPDVLIVARGGGSLEDLWAFNEEAVVRAVAASAIPVISAVGHETDTTLCDFAADVRAPTPTAAAEMAVPVRLDVLAAVRQLSLRQEQALARYLTGRAEKLAASARLLPQVRDLVHHAGQFLDDRAERLNRALPQFLERHAQRLAVVAARFRPALLRRQLEADGVELARGWQRVCGLAAERIAREEQRLAAIARLLDSMHYRRILERGFALVRDGAGQVVTGRRQAAAAPVLELEFHDGRLTLTPGGGRAKKASAPAAAGAAKPQGDLFG